MQPVSRWIVVTALGLSAGVGLAVALQSPVEALVGMVLLTPVLTLLVGGILGAAQWIELRRRIQSSGRWLASTALGLGVGLAVGIVALEVIGQLLLGHPMRLLQMEPAGRALSFLILGGVAGSCLGLAQWLVLRRSAVLPTSWPLLSAAGLGLGFSSGSLLVDGAMAGLTSPVGLATLFLVSGAVLGACTARPLARVRAN